jgi:hypothetical protein
MKTINVVVLLLAVFYSIHFYSCTKSKESNSKVTPQTDITKKENLNSAGVKEGGHEFNVQYSQPRRIYRLEKI